MFNATQLSTIAYSLIHEEENPLHHYSTLDFSSLSWAEKKWAAWYIWVGNPVIATGLMSFVMHEVGRGASNKMLFQTDGTFSLACVLRSLCAMDDYRPDRILQAMETAAGEGKVIKILNWAI